jgi:hypothetical protein
VIDCLQITSARGHPRGASRGGAASGPVESACRMAVSSAWPDWPAWRKPAQQGEATSLSG